MAVAPLSHHFFSLNQCSGNFLLADENSTTIRVVCVLMCDKRMLHTKTLVKQELSSQFFKYQTEKKKKHKLTIDLRIFMFSGNSYKFKVGSKANALLWYRYLQGAAKTRLEYKVSHCELLMIYLVSLCSMIVRERTETRGVCRVFFVFFVFCVAGCKSICFCNF